MILDENVYNNCLQKLQTAENYKSASAKKKTLKKFSLYINESIESLVCNNIENLRTKMTDFFGMLTNPETWKTTKQNTIRDEM